MNKKISYGSMAEILPESQFSNDLRQLNEEFKKYDPDGRKAFALAKKYGRKITWDKRVLNAINWVMEKAVIGIIYPVIKFLELIKILKKPNKKESKNP